MSETIIVPVALGHTEKAHEMVSAAKKLGGDGCRIVLLSVVEDIPGYIAAQIPAGYETSAKEMAQEELLKVAAAEKIEPDIQIRKGTPHREILDLADDIKASAIIIGSHRPGIEDYILGSTAARVVRHAKCSVLVLRGGEG
jgi:universal stress protein F